MGIYLKGIDVFPIRESSEGKDDRLRPVDMFGLQGFGSTAVEVEMNGKRALEAHSHFLRKQGRVLPSIALDGAEARDSYIM